MEDIFPIDFCFWLPGWSLPLGACRPGTKTRLLCRRSDPHVFKGVRGFRAHDIDFDPFVGESWESRSYLNPHHGGCLFKWLLRSGMEDMICSLLRLECAANAMFLLYVFNVTMLPDTSTMTGCRSSSADSVSLCCYVLVSPSSAWQISIRRAFMQHIILVYFRYAHVLMCWPVTILKLFLTWDAEKFVQ